MSYANIATAPAKTPKAPSIMSTCAVGLATATPVEEEVAAAVIELTALLVRTVLKVLCVREVLEVVLELESDVAVALETVLSAEAIASVVTLPVTLGATLAAGLIVAGREKYLQVLVKHPLSS